MRPKKTMSVMHDSKPLKKGFLVAKKRIPKLSTDRNRDVEIPEEENEVWNKERPVVPKNTKAPFIIQGMNLIPWGGTISSDGVSIPVVNTCSFDNIFFVLYALFKTVV